jgi:hypothetical protein
MYIPRELLLRIIYRTTRLWVVMHYYARDYYLSIFLGVMRRKISLTPEKIEFLLS